jgi:hypothetical protein
MANLKISELSPVIAVTNNYVLAIVNGGETKKITVADLIAYNQLGWNRIDDTVYTSSNKLSLSDGVQITLPNNAGNVIKCGNDYTFYDSATNKILGLDVNDVYILTVVFSSAAANTNSTHLDFALEGSGQINRVSKTLQYHKGNGVEQNFHEVYQYYTDADFVANGVTPKIVANGGTAEIWDIIFFIQRTQRYI